MIPWHTFKPKQGQLLLAEPSLHDSFFSRAVILLLAHDEMGSMGLIINKQTDSSRIEGVLRNKTVYLGGPVSGNEVHVLHNALTVLGSDKILEGVYLNGDASILHQVAKHQTQGKIFLGYCGWSQGQLDQEVLERSWIVLPATPNWVFEQETHTLWEKLLKEMGHPYSGLLNYPKDVRWN